MRSTSGIRLSDGEREHALATLQRHYAEGRLDDDELELRVSYASRARTRGELAPLFADLPRGVGVRAADLGRRVDRILLRAHAATYAGINGTWVGIWALEGAGFFWPAVPLVGWGAVLLGHRRISRAVRRALPEGAASRRVAG